MADWSELEQLAEAATKGVWEVDPEEIISPHSGAVLGVYIRRQKKGGRIAEFFANCLVKTDELCRANARFAAAANPKAIRALIAENKRFDRRRLELVAQCNEVYAKLQKAEAELTQFRTEVEALRAYESQPLLCDYCSVETADPWHGSGLLRGSESRHIHACDQCRHLLPGYPAAASTDKEVAHG